MPRENLTQKRERAAEIERRMFEHYGEGACSLDHVDPFTLTVAVILSAQCTDAAVNKVTPELFARFGTPEAMAAASIEDIEAIIHPLGFFRSKAKNLKAWCANGACRIWWRSAAYYGRFAEASWSGAQNGKCGYVPGVSRPSGHRCRYACIPHRPSAGVCDAQRRYA